MGGAIAVKPLGKILLIVCCVLYIVVGILTFVSCVIYLKQGFGIGDEGYKLVKEQCKTLNFSETIDPKNFTQEDAKSFCESLNITLAAIFLALILSVLLLVAGVFLLLIVFKGFCWKRWFLIWLIIAVILALFSLLVLILLFFASLNDGLQKMCQLRHDQFYKTYGRELKPPCDKGNNFASVRQYPECFRSWQKFESYLKKLWKLLLGALVLLLILNILALIAFIIIYFCCKKKNGNQPHQNALTVVNLPPNITEKDLKKKFPGALGIYIDKKTGIARIMFPDYDRMKTGIKGSGLLRLGPTKVSWLRPEELYIVDVDPDMSADDLQKEFPTAKSIKFQTATDPDMRIATVIFPNETEQKKAYDSSSRKKVGLQQLDGGYGSGGGGGGGGADNELRISNLPPDVNEEDLKKKFPNSKNIKMDKGSGTAKIQFDDGAAAKKEYDDSDLVKLGKPKLGWLRPEELYIMDVPSSVSDKDLLKDFPTAKGVKFQKGEGGKRIATIVFPNEAEQKKAYASSNWTKLGPQKLAYGGGSGNGNEIQISNLPPDVDEEDLKKKFPNAKNVKMDKGSGTARIQFDDSGAAKKAYDDSDLLKLGRPKLGFLRPEELYIMDVPKNINESDLLKDFPTAKGVKFQKGEGGKRIATIVFPSEAEQKKSFNDSDWKKLGPQKLAYGGSGGGGKGKNKKGNENEGVDIEGNGDLTDDELARKLWKTPEAGFSNISNLFHPKLYVLNTPPGTTRKQLLETFETAEKVDIRGKVGILEFESPQVAAHAFHVAKKKTLNGQKMQISIHEPKGKKRKGSAKSSRSRRSSKKSKGGLSKSSSKKKNQVGAL